MVHSENKYVASTIVALSIYVDLAERKVAEFEKEKVQIMDEYILKHKDNFKIDNLKFLSKLKK